MGKLAKRQSVDAKSSGQAWDQWVDGLHEALGQAKRHLATHEGISPEWLESMMRSFHLIKGFAQPLGLNGVQAVAHDLESRLVSLLSGDAHAAAKPKLGEGELRAMLLEGVAKLDGVLARMHELQLAAAARLESDAGAPSWSRLFGRIESAARGIALDLKRELRFEAVVGAMPALAKAWEEPLEAALLHAVRNSLDHGTQGEAGRISIRLSAERKGGEIVVVCEDSGVGIDPQRVREAARARHARFDAEMGSMTDEDVLQLLFLPGLSLSRGVSRLSGRGYGLNIVRDAVETRLQGKARIESRPGDGTRLVLTVPAV